MTRKKQKARPQEENSGQPNPNEPRSPGLPGGKVTEPGGKGRNVTTKNNLRAQKDRSQQLSSYSSIKVVEDGSVLAQSSTSVSPVVPKREEGSSNLAWRPIVNSSTEGGTPEDPPLSAPQQGRHSNVTNSVFVSSPGAAKPNRWRQRQRQRQGGQPGHSPAASRPPLYVRSIGPLLPYDVDGVDASEQRKFQTLAGGEPALSALQESHSPVVKENPEYMSDLRSFLAKEDELRRKGYVLEPLSQEELERKKRCKECKRALRPHRSKKEDKGAEAKAEKQAEKQAETRQGFHESNILPRVEESGELNNKDSTVEKKPIVRCKFHAGTVRNKKWTCCGKHISSDPCSGLPNHETVQYRKGEIELLWQFHETPMPLNYSKIRPAVAIDCEMGSAKSGDSELIRITLIDYFSSHTLIDSLVYPDVPMEHYRTRYSGVTWKDMETARKRKTCIRGRDNARRAVWKFVGPATIVVGHSANNDLEALRWIHPAVVDTFLVESLLMEAQKDDKPGDKDRKAAVESEKGPALEQSSSALPTDPVTADGSKTKEGGRQKKPKGSGQLSLKTLAKARLDREIQNAGKNGHDSLEDALAARDLAHWHVVNRRESGSKSSPPTQAGSAGAGLNST